MFLYKIAPTWFGDCVSGAFFLRRKLERCDARDMVHDYFTCVHVSKKNKSFLSVSVR